MSDLTPRGGKYLIIMGGGGGGAIMIVEFYQWLSIEAISLNFVNTLYNQKRYSYNCYILPCIILYAIISDLILHACVCICVCPNLCTIMSWPQNQGVIIDPCIIYICMHLPNYLEIWRYFLNYHIVPNTSPYYTCSSNILVSMVEQYPLWYQLAFHAVSTWSMFSCDIMVFIKGPLRHKTVTWHRTLLDVTSVPRNKKYYLELLVINHNII